MVENAGILNAQAIKLAGMGAAEEAVACLERAITIEKDNHLLWLNLGITLRDSGKFAGARKALEQAYELCSSDEDVIETLAVVCYDMGEFEDALVYCCEGLEDNPRNPHLWNTSGVVYFNRKEYREAAEAFESAVMIDPYYYDALYNLRDTYKELGNVPGIAEMELRMKEIEK